MPRYPQMMPPVGKSGPGMIFMTSSTVAKGLSKIIIVALTSSFRLWGGIFVAMPTAMPEEPLHKRLGNFEGKTVGSFFVSS